MATVTLDLPNMNHGALVEVDGLGIFANGETHELNDSDVAIYILQRKNADGYAFRNTNGLTFSGLDDYIYPEEEIEQPESSFRMPGEVVHVDENNQPIDLTTMGLKQLHDYAASVNTNIPDGIRLKADVLAFLQNGTIPEGVTND